jgi:putative oxidoreductase
MKTFPIPKTRHLLIALRILIGLIMVSHGAMRIYVGTVGGFGEFLSSSGFPAGTVIAWGITVFEISGGLTLAAGHLLRWLPLCFAFEHIMGIVLVHAPRGWFVVGHSVGGAEYSSLLLLCFLLIASTGWNKADLR